MIDHAKGLISKRLPRCGICDINLEEALLCDGCNMHVCGEHSQLFGAHERRCDNCVKRAAEERTSFAEDTPVQGMPEDAGHIIAKATGAKELKRKVEGPAGTELPSGGFLRKPPGLEDLDEMEATAKLDDPVRRTHMGVVFMNYVNQEARYEIPPSHEVLAVINQFKEIRGNMISDVDRAKREYHKHLQEAQKEKMEETKKKFDTLSFNAEELTKSHQ